MAVNGLVKLRNESDSLEARLDSEGMKTFNCLLFKPHIRFFMTVFCHDHHLV